MPDQLIEAGKLSDKLLALAQALSGPRCACIAFAFALGRLVHACGLDMETMVSVARDAHRISGELTDERARDQN